MANELFLDTSAWFPVVMRRHSQHAAVASVLDREVRAGHRIVTTNLIIAETHALLLTRDHRTAAMTFVQSLRQSPTLVVHSDAELEGRAVIDWLGRYNDQNFSFADAVSFAVMKSRNIQRALTMDRHFAVAGFEMIPG